VDSSVGKGSVFWFELNSAAAPLSGNIENEMALTEAIVSCDKQKHTVLYVEDDPANMQLVVQIIALDPDITLLTAENGKMGIDIARSSLPDLILLDINLPDVNGFEVMNRLQSEPSTANIPVIAVSANAMPRDVKKGLEAGFFRYITKPIKINELRDAVDAALKLAAIKPKISH
jgi:CheY-like chemotaxis protein